MLLPARVGACIAGCVLLGIGVGLVLGADFGSDGYSTMINGLALHFSLPFWSVNIGAGVLLVVVAALRGVRPGIGTVIQVAAVGPAVSLTLAAIGTVETTAERIVLATLAIPVLSLGTASYLGTHLGAGPAEAAALAWDPPVPFRWTYTAVQAGGGLIGWLLGATIGPATLGVILLLGLGVDLASRVLRLDIHQARVRPPGPRPTS